ncbi:uncharacterized protein si:dkeyp-97a10.2 [Lampris incognitus]|uniref:uncharacterized protein si:dkeyp-97a10.2 n=1 Tax=Lampris incognitus TaxID=2546036 RepID=UPI0024B4B041|nr:uncharacterized protein si:dkeyp-97a10.2 [Lampris incognitus]
MDLKHFLRWRVAILLLLVPCGYECLSVRILNEEPVHVIPHSTLALQAHIEHGPLEEVSMITWERGPETGNPSGKETLATCSGKSLKCVGKTPNGHVSLEHQGSTLSLPEYSSADSGVYVVTVTDQMGAKTSAQCIVREYEAVHHVSVSVNVSHSTLVCGEAWGTDPGFTWLHERAAITAAVGRVSKDGKSLYVSTKPLCGHFTCVVQNKLGHTSATYTAEPCESEGKGTSAAVVCLVILLLLVGGALVFLLWRNHRQYSNRGERLHNYLVDNI